jgi:hypothetical protein
MTDPSVNGNEPITRVYLDIPGKFVLGALGVIVIGAILLVFGSQIYGDGWRRLQLGYLVALCFVLSLSLGSLFIVILQHLTRAGWSVAIRRPAEILALNVVGVAVLALPLAWWVSRGELYPWAADNLTQAPSTLHADHSTASHPGVHTTASHGKSEQLYVHQTLDELTRSKSSWLNQSGFLVRMAVYLGIWVLLAGFYFSQSKRQDEAPGEVMRTRRMERLAGPAIIAFAITLTLAAFDWLMSLDPHWYSTMFGVYYFAGCAVGGFAVNLLLWLLIQQHKRLTRQISAEHLRDLGRFLFAFVFFWGYIAFSQYMLLWYANIPETTRWLAVRGASLAEGYANSWGWLLLLLLFGHFLIPFLGIMSRHVKSNSQAMICWTIWLLVMHYCDLYWLVMPEIGGQLTFGLLEIGNVLLVGGIWVLSASFIATRISLLPVGDPRLGESLRIVDAY